MANDPIWPHPNPTDPRLIEEGKRFSAELDAVNRVHRQAQSDIAAKYIRRYSAIGRGEDVPFESAITLTRPAIIEPDATVGNVPFGFGKL